MQLIITKENLYLELEDNIKIVANEFGVRFWENFFSVDAKTVQEEDVNLENYSCVFEDFNAKLSKKVTNKNLTQLIIGKTLQNSLF